MRILNLLPLLLVTGYTATCQIKPERVVGGGCENCDLMLEGMPKTLQPNTTIASVKEPGNRILIHGIVYKSDGKTPAPNVILYFYHTDHTGRYTASSGQVHGVKHGHLRGWIKTGNDGKYEIESTRPASYPDSDTPQHIHVIVKEDEIQPYWIDEYLFDDDPFLTKSERDNQQKRGGNGVLKLTKNSNGKRVGIRNITLGLNVPGY